MCRSPSQSVHASLPKSAPVAVLSCCTELPQGRATTCNGPRTDRMCPPLSSAARRTTLESYPSACYAGERGAVPPLGTQTAAAADLPLRRAHRPRQPPACAPGSPPPGHGHGRSPPRSPASRPSHRLTSRKPSLRPGRTIPGQWNPAHPARQSGHQARPSTEKQSAAAASSHRSKITKDAG
jgi:hypothetical protein